MKTFINLFFRTRPKADKDRFEEDLATRNDTVLKFAKKFQIEGDLSQETVTFENKIYLSELIVSYDQLRKINTVLNIVYLIFFPVINDGPLFFRPSKFELNFFQTRNF